jgi:hypothetical protein
MFTKYCPFSTRASWSLSYFGARLQRCLVSLEDAVRKRLTTRYRPCVLLSIATGQNNKLGVEKGGPESSAVFPICAPRNTSIASYAFVSIRSDANNQSLFQWSFTVEVRNPAAQSQEAVHLAAVLQIQAEGRRS